MAKLAYSKAAGTAPGHGVPPAAPVKGAASARNAGALVTTGTTLPACKSAGNAHKKQNTASQGGVTNAKLWELQKAMWGVTDIKALAGCHRWLDGTAGAANVQWAAGGTAKFGGLQNSKSVWASPLAAATITRARGQQVHLAVSNFLQANPQGSVVFGTFTIRHNKGQSAKLLWDALGKAWNGITGGNPWRTDCKKYAVAHWVKAVEATYGQNGWHIHLHVVFLLDKHLTSPQLAAFGDRMYARWAKRAKGCGLQAPSRKHGVVLQQANGNAADQAKQISAYLTKGNIGGVAKELTGAVTKQGRKKSVTPFQILHILAQCKKGSKQYKRWAAVWRTWEAVSRGRRFMAWSKGTKAALGVANLSNAELIAQAQNAELSEHKVYSVAQVAHQNWARPVGTNSTALCSNIEARQMVLQHVQKATTPEEAAKFAAYALGQFGVPHTSNIALLSPP